MGHCFAWHVQVNFGFCFKFKIEEFVHSGLWMWHNSIFTFARIKILLWEINKCYTFDYQIWRLFCTLNKPVRIFSAHEFLFKLLLSRTGITGKQAELMCRHCIVALWATSQCLNIISQMGNSLLSFGFASCCCCSTGAQLSHWIFAFSLIDFCILFLACK